jgi:hypothetical protein
MEQFRCSLFSSCRYCVGSWKGCPSGQEVQAGTFGGYQVRANTQQSQLTMQCSKDPTTSRLGSAYGKLGRLTSVSSSFYSWLITAAGQWAVERLACCNLPNPGQCPLCDQGETINHLLITCVFAQQFWSLLLQWVCVTGVSPQPHETTFNEWWRRVISLVSTNIRGF